MNSRTYTSRRYAIATALCEELKKINGEGDFRVNLWKNVHPRLVFWDEVEEYPALHIGLGNETRVYQGGGFKERFLTVTLRCYVKEEDPQKALELLLEDIETVIEQNGRLAYQDSSGTTQFTQEILIMGIDTDEGALAPLGAGEVTLTVRY